MGNSKNKRSPEEQKEHHIWKQKRKELEQKRYHEIEHTYCPFCGSLEEDHECGQIV